MKNRKENRRSVSALTLVLFGTLMAVVYSGCAARSEEVDKKDATKMVVPVLTIENSDTIFNTRYVASIQAEKNIEVRTKIDGFLDKIFVDEGAFVQKGQLLFQLNSMEFKAGLAKAEANLASAMAEVSSADLEVGRVKVLADKKVISKTELSMALARKAAAEAKVKEAKAMLEQAQLHLNYTSIRAPFSGIINRIPQKQGSLVEQSTLLTTLSNIQHVYAYFNVSETEYLSYQRSLRNGGDQKSRRVTLTLPDGTSYPHSGVIETIEGEFDATTGSIAFRAKFDNPEKLLRHGSSGKINITQPIQNTVLIPQKAAMEIQDQYYVFVVDQQNKVQMRNFTRGLRLGSFYEVLEGLQPGDKIVVEGWQNLKNGMEISPAKAS